MWVGGWAGRAGYKNHKNLDSWNGRSRRPQPTPHTTRCCGRCDIKLCSWTRPRTVHRRCRRRLPCPATPSRPSRLAADPATATFATRRSLRDGRRWSEPGITVEVHTAATMAQRWGTALPEFSQNYATRSAHGDLMRIPRDDPPSAKAARAKLSPAGASSTLLPAQQSAAARPRRSTGASAARPTLSPGTAISSMATSVPSRVSRVWRGFATGHSSLRQACRRAAACRQ